jgi:5'-3' exonuclease
MLLIDADILSYRIGYACKDETVETAFSQLNNLVLDILVRGCDDAVPYQLYLTGKGNFRNALATIQPYKGTRTSEKPSHFYALRDYMTEEWDAVVVEGQEADDAIAIEATTQGKHTVIASVDKDFLQVPCRHFNINKREWSEVNEWQGLYFLYKQMLTGDRVDNIQGCVGIGEVKATKALEWCETEEDLYQAVVTCYKGHVEGVYENARLLFLRRYENEWWVDPVARKQNYNSKNPIAVSPPQPPTSADIDAKDKLQVRVG